MTPNQTKIFKASLTLGAIVFLFVWANSTTLKDPNKKNLFRFPASQFIGEMRSASLAVEKKFAAKIALVTKGRKIASVGRPASELENFRFGVLEGKYALTMDGDQISNVSFIDNPASEGRPTPLGDRSEFFNKFGMLFGIDRMPEKISVDVDGHHVVETYQLKNQKGGQLTVKLILDDSDRLISLQSNKVPSTKIF